MTTQSGQEESARVRQIRLNIPERDLETLHKLVRMDDEHLAGLWHAIGTAPVGSLGQALETHLAATASLSRVEASDIALVLSHIYLTKVRRDEWTANELLHAIASALAETRQVDLTDHVLGVLSRMLSFERILGLSARAKDVLSEYERIMDEVRILTDIRPVFEPGSEPSLSATLVVHNLRIRYIDNSGRPKEFIVALDSNDLENLEKATRRAIAKESEIRAFMSRAGMHCIKVASE